MRTRLIFLLFLALLLSQQGHAQVPNLINYQGRVVVGSTNFNGNGQFKFALVDTTGATTYWSNDGTSTSGSQPTNGVSLTVNQGLYSVILGDSNLTNMTPIPPGVFGNSDVRLRVWFNDGTNGFQQLTPDQRITSVGYALVAGTVPKGAITSTQLGSGAAAANLNGETGTLNLGGYSLTLPPASVSIPTLFTTGTASGSTCLVGNGTWGSFVSSFNTRTGAVVLTAADLSAVTPPITFGSTTTGYQPGNVFSVKYLDANTTLSPGGTLMSTISDWVPPLNTNVQKLNISDAVFLDGPNNAGDIVVHRATASNRSTGNLNSIECFDTHGGNQSYSVAGGSGTLGSFTSFSAGSPDADALDTIGTSIGITINSQKIPGVTTGIGINQLGVNDENVFLGFLNVYANGSNFTFGTTTGTKLGIGNNQKIAFWGNTPIVQPSGDLVSAISAEGLCASPTLGGNDVNPYISSSPTTSLNNATAVPVTNNGAKGNSNIVANKLVVGSTYRLTMMGYYSTTGTPTLNLIWGTYSGGLSLTFGSSGAQTMPLNASNYEWQAQYTFTVQTTGSSGTLIGQGWADIQTGAGTSARYPILNTTTSTINTTTSNWIMGFAQWGTAASGNTLTCTNATVEQLY